MTTTTKRLADDVYPEVISYDHEERHGYVVLNLEHGSIDSMSKDYYNTSTYDPANRFVTINSNTSNVGISKIEDECRFDCEKLAKYTEIKWDGHNWSRCFIENSEMSEEDYNEAISELEDKIIAISEDHELLIADYETVRNFFEDEDDLLTTDVDILAMRVLEDIKNDGYYCDFDEDFVRREMLESVAGSENYKIRAIVDEYDIELHGAYCEECGEALNDEEITKTDVCDACALKLAE